MNNYIKQNNPMIGVIYPLDKEGLASPCTSPEKLFVLFAIIV